MSPAPLSVGDVIHGYAEGAFGRDSYNCRRVEAVGPDWIVTRSCLGTVELLGDPDDLRRAQRARDTRCTLTDAFGDLCCPFTGEEPRLTSYRG